jgi:uncharacterized phiE125 gp8 family phage protein
MSITLITEPETEPVSLTEIKEHLRLDDNDSDGELLDLIKEGRRYVEGITGRALITQTWEFRLDAFCLSLNIPKPPLQAVSSIQYQDANNATQTLNSSNYTVDIYSQPARVVQSNTGTYPATYNDLNAVTITYDAGYGNSASDVPGVFKRAIKLYVEMMFDNPTSSYADALEGALLMSLLHYKVDNIAL